MRYKTLLFDLDGTLLDTLDDLTDSVNHTLQTYGLPTWNRADIRARLGNGLRNLLAASLPPDKESLLEEAAQTFSAYYLAHDRIKTRPYPGVLDMLAKLRKKGCAVAVISNKGDAAARHLCEDFFGDLVDYAVGERTGIPRKPAPDAVFAALEALGAEKESAVYIGDSEVDAQTARNAGLPCVLVTWGFRDREQLAAFPEATLIDNADDLLDWMVHNRPVR